METGGLENLITEEEYFLQPMLKRCECKLRIPNRIDIFLEF